MINFVEEETLKIPKDLIQFIAQSNIFPNVIYK